MSSWNTRASSVSRAAARRLNARGRIGAGSSVYVGNQHRRTTLRQQKGAGLADAHARTCNKGGSPLEIPIHLLHLPLN